ncbi:MAG: hypothetical protein KAS93_06650 [Gammaproteobacteria bacterium]|nr:hypothetical protein [Gammaproteobacteria bacterium]
MEADAIPYKEVKLIQTKNGICVVESRIDCLGSRQWVFSEMKDLKAFIGKNFLDAKAAEKLEAKALAAEKKLLSRKAHKEK